MPSFQTAYALPAVNCVGTTATSAVWTEQVGASVIFRFTPPRPGLYKFTHHVMFNGQGGVKDHYGIVRIERGAAGSTACANTTEFQSIESTSDAPNTVSGSGILALQATDRVAICVQVNDRSSGSLNNLRVSGGADTVVMVEEVGVATP